MEVSGARRPEHALLWALLLLVGAPAAQAAPPAPAPRAAPPAPDAVVPLAASAPPAPADGLTVIPVTVTGGPPRDDAEREDHPALPAVTCPDAVTYPPVAGRPPAILAPFLPTGGTLRCSVRLRGATAAFTVRLERPASGVYVALRRGTDVDPHRLQLVGVILPPGGAPREAKRVLAASSAGPTATAGPAARLVLPHGPPRAVAVVLDVDGHPAASFFPVAGRVELPVRARRARSVTVRLPGVYAGPFEVHDARVAAPVEVPPGVETAVVRALSARGEAREEVVDLSPPQLPRLAVLVPEPGAPAGTTRPIYVAVADQRGAPAGPEMAPTARATRGRVKAPIARGPGLWELTYRAPDRPGPDDVTVTVPGDAAAGAAAARMLVTAGPPRAARVVLPRRALGPGERLVARLTVRDASGNVLRGVRLRADLGGEPAQVSEADDGYLVAAVVPERLSARTLRLRVEGAGPPVEADVHVAPGPGASAHLTISAARRTAAATLSVADQYGNPLEPDAFAVRADGARVGPLVRADGGFRAALAADPTAREAVVEIIASGRTLARERVRFAAPPGILHLGAWAGAGWLSNLGDVSAPRFGGGPAVRRAIGPIELTVATGVEGVVWSDQVTRTVAGADRSLARRLRAVVVPVSLRGRLALPRSLGAALAVVLAPCWVDGRTSTDFQQPETFSKWIVGVRGEASGDLALGPGRLVLALGYGHASLAGTPMTGNVDGIYVRLGYEWWFWSPER